MARFDVLILGGGAAGCALAGRLSENPDRSVCLVEAGPDYGHLSEGRWPADILDPRWLALESHLWARADEDDRSQSRARILGGCSAHNACVLLEGAPSDYDWGGDWSYDAFAPYLRRAYETLRGHVLADDELTPWHRAFRAAGGEGSIVHPVNIVDGVRWHTGFAYVDPARARENLTILADTIADRVLLEDGRAVGALAGGRELRAETVVVSASAYGSPAILLAQRHRPRRRGRAAAGRRRARRPRRRERGLGADRAPAGRDRGPRGRARALHGPGDGGRLEPLVPAGRARPVRLPLAGGRAGDQRRRLRDEAALAGLGAAERARPGDAARDRSRLPARRTRRRGAGRGLRAAARARGLAGGGAVRGQRAAARRDSRRRGARARDRARLLPPGRHLRDRERARRTVPRARLREPLRGGRLGDPGHPRRQHEPDHGRAGRARGQWL